jgi:hypothetical protein
MSLQFDEKGKFFTDVVPKSAMHATMQTTTGIIRGCVHVREGQRLKDELDSDEPFLAVTDATVMGPDGEAIVFRAAFIAVRRTHLVWVMPDSEDRPVDSNDRA